MKKNPELGISEAFFSRDRKERILNPYADADRDGVLNFMDCKPFDPAEHGALDWGIGVYKKYVPAPIKRVVTPVARPVYKKVKKVARPVYKKVKKVVRPVHKKVKKVVRPVHKKVKKVVRPVHKKVKKVVEPVYKEIRERVTPDIVPSISIPKFKIPTTLSFVGKIPPKERITKISIAPTKKVTVGDVPFLFKGAFKGERVGRLAVTGRVGLIPEKRITHPRIVPPRKVAVPSAAVFMTGISAIPVTKGLREFVRATPVYKAGERVGMWAEREIATPVRAAATAERIAATGFGATGGMSYEGRVHQIERDLGLTKGRTLNYYMDDLNKVYTQKSTQDYYRNITAGREVKKPKSVVQFERQLKYIEKYDKKHGEGAFDRDISRFGRKTEGMRQLADVAMKKEMPPEEPSTVWERSPTKVGFGDVLKPYGITKPLFTKATEATTKYRIWLGKHEMRKEFKEHPVGYPIAKFGMGALIAPGALAEFGAMTPPALEAVGREPSKMAAAFVPGAAFMAKGMVREAYKRPYEFAGEIAAMQLITKGAAKVSPVRAARVDIARGSVWRGIGIERPTIRSMVGKSSIEPTFRPIVGVKAGEVIIGEPLKIRLGELMVPKAIKVKPTKITELKDLVRRSEKLGKDIIKEKINIKKYRERKPSSITEKRRLSKQLERTEKSVSEKIKERDIIDETIKRRADLPEVAIVPKKVMEVVTKEGEKLITDYDKITKSLLRGKKVSDLSLPEFTELLKNTAKKVKIIKVVNGYGIYVTEWKGNMVYNAMNMKSGLNILSGRRSLKEIIVDIKEGVPAQVIRETPIMGSVKGVYEYMKRSAVAEEKYGGRAHRFEGRKGDKVLDIGAGNYPDLRASHAIDLVKSDKKFTNLEYKHGYDFSKETTKLPYKDNSFDVIVSYGALGKNFETQIIFNEIRRVLKPGGRLEFNADSLNTQMFLKRAGFEKARMEKYFDKSLNTEISVIVAKKPLLSEIREGMFKVDIPPEGFEGASAIKGALPEHVLLSAKAAKEMTTGVEVLQKYARIKPEIKRPLRDVFVQRIPKRALGKIENLLKKHEHVIYGSVVEEMFLRKAPHKAHDIDLGILEKDMSIIREKLVNILSEELGSKNVRKAPKGKGIEVLYNGRWSHAVDIHPLSWQKAFHQRPAFAVKLRPWEKVNGITAVSLGEQWVKKATTWLVPEYAKKGQLWFKSEWRLKDIPGFSKIGRDVEFSVAQSAERAWFFKSMKREAAAKLKEDLKFIRGEEIAKHPEIEAFMGGVPYSPHIKPYAYLREFPHKTVEIPIRAVPYPTPTDYFLPKKIKYHKRCPPKYPKKVPPKYPKKVPPKYPKKVPPKYPKKVPPKYPKKVPPKYPKKVPPKYPKKVPPKYPKKVPPKYPPDEPRFFPPDEPRFFPPDEPPRYPKEYPPPKEIPKKPRITKEEKEKIRKSKYRKEDYFKFGEITGVMLPGEMVRKAPKKRVKRTPGKPRKKRSVTASYMLPM